MMGLVRFVVISDVRIEEAEARLDTSVEKDSIQVRKTSQNFIDLAWQRGEIRGIHLRKRLSITRHEKHLKTRSPVESQYLEVLA